MLAIVLTAGAVGDAVTTCLAAPAIYRTEVNPVSHLLINHVGVVPYMTAAAAVMVSVAGLLAAGRIRLPALALLLLALVAFAEVAVTVNNATKLVRGTVLVAVPY